MINMFIIILNYVQKHLVLLIIIIIVIKYLLIIYKNKIYYRIG